MPLNEVLLTNPWLLIGAGAAGFLVWFLMKHGFTQGQTAVAKGESSATAQVVAISADSGSLNRLTASIEAHSFTSMQNQKQLEDRSDTFFQRMHDMTREMSEMRSTLRELILEMARKR